MASAKMANTVTRYADAADDQSLLDGSAATGAPGWSDIKAVYVAPTRMPAKLLTKMKSDYPPGTHASFYGDAWDLRRKDRVVFVAVEMAGKLPQGARGQQVEIGFSGNAATPVQAGTHADTLAGVESFSLSGLFSNGAYGTGTTDVGGREPNAPLELGDYYNADAGTFGFYSQRRGTWYIVVPRAGDTDSITVAVRSTTAEGQVLDRLELPGGGHFVDLLDPAGGYRAKGGLPPLACRSLETFSSESEGVSLSDAGATLIRYTAGVAADARANVTRELLAPAAEAMGPVEVVLTPAFEGEPATVDGELAVSPAGNAISLTFEVPAGQWTFALAEDLELTTPAGEAIIDHTTLTGTAGVLTGPGLDGFVAGDLSCAAGPLADAGDATGSAAGDAGDSGDGAGSASGGAAASDEAAATDPGPEEPEG